MPQPPWEWKHPVVGLNLTSRWRISFSDATCFKQSHIFIEVEVDKLRRAEMFSAETIHETFWRVATLHDVTKLGLLHHIRLGSISTNLEEAKHD